MVLSIQHTNNTNKVQRIVVGVALTAPKTMTSLLIRSQHQQPLPQGEQPHGMLRGREKGECPALVRLCFVQAGPSGPTVIRQLLW